MQYVISFGSDHLKKFKVNPLNILLVIEASNEQEAREIVRETKGIGNAFCTSYTLEWAKSTKYFKTCVYLTLEQLEELRK